jgi:two-component system sensor histidine kinase GlrK
MKLGLRITGGYLALILLMAGVAAYHLMLVSRLHRTNRRLFEIGYESADATQHLQTDLGRLSKLTAKYLVLQDPDYAAALSRIRLDFDRQLARLAELVGSDEERRALAFLAASWADYLEAAPPGELQYADLLDRRHEIESLFPRLESRLDALVAASRRARASEVERNAAWGERARWLAWGATALSFCFALALSHFTVRSVVTPLGQLTSATRELARGHFSYRVLPSGSVSEEVAALEENFNSMAHRLDELDQLKNDFICHVSHELRAPLTSMQESINLLLEGIPGPLTDKQARLLALNRRCSERLSTMIGNLLDLSKLDAEVIQYEVRRHDLLELARTSIEELANLLLEKGIHVHLRAPARPQLVECDGARIIQVIENLISNAWRFSPPASTIGVTVRERTSELVLPPEMNERVGGPSLPSSLIEVHDSGPGVPDPEKEKIFQRFYRVSSSAQDKPGTGLGLSIARTITEHHGGALWVRDRPPGGSTFSLLLPSRASALLRSAGVASPTVDSTPAPRRKVG